MNLLKLVVYLIGMSSFSVANAEEYLVISTISHHWNRNDVKSENLNERNFGLGIEHTNSNKIYGTGFYKNSYQKESWYLTVEEKMVVYRGFYTGPRIGLVTGYIKHQVVGLGGWSVGYIKDNYGFNILIVPSVSYKLTTNA